MTAATSRCSRLSFVGALNGQTLTEKRTLGGQPDPSDATSGVVYRIEPAE